jgi:phosphate transport system permease protein
MAFELDGKVVAQDAAGAWDLFGQHHGPSRNRWRERRGLEKDEIGAISRLEESARLAAVEAGLRHGPDSVQHRLAEDAYRRAQAEAADAHAHARILVRIGELDRENDRYQLVLRTAGGEELRLSPAEIVRAYPANQLGWPAKLRVYASRWWEFLTDEPREATRFSAPWR